MARIVFPVRFLDWRAQFTKVKAKHIADGAGSPLTSYLTAQSIDFTGDQTAVDDAVDKHALFAQAEKDAEKLSAARDLLFEAVFSDHRNAVQVLKKFFKVNVNQLGDWGVTVDGRGRITYPVDFVSKQAAVIAFMDKHDSYAAGTSPLQPFLDANAIDLTANRTKANNALIGHNDYIQLNEDKENYRELRDNALDPVKDHLHGIGAFLVGLYPKNPHIAGDWGYVIDASAKGSRERIVKLGEGAHKTIQNVVVESIMQNIGTIPLLVYPGKVEDPDEPTGIPSPITLNAGDIALVKRGYGTITLKNTVLTSKAAIKLIVFK